MSLVVVGFEEALIGLYLGLGNMMTVSCSVPFSNGRQRNRQKILDFHNVSLNILTSSIIVQKMDLNQ